MSKTNKEILGEANAAIVKGDYEGFLEFCTDDTDWTFLGDRTIKGKEAVRRWMASAYKEPPRFEVHRLVAEGDTVAAIGTITLPDGQGRPTRHAYCDVWRLRGGKLAALHAFVIATGDSLGALAEPS